MGFMNWIAEWKKYPWARGRTTVPGLWMSKWSRHCASDEPPSGSIKGSLVGLGLQRFRLCLCQHRREACGGPLLAVGDLAIAEFHQAQLATGRLDHVDGKERAIDALCHLFH